MQGNDGKFKLEHDENELRRHVQTIPVIPGMNAIAFTRRSRAYRGVSKDGCTHSYHPSRLAEDGEHLQR
jgi:hypothetical protein